MEPKDINCNPPKIVTEWFSKWNLHELLGFAETFYVGSYNKKDYISKQVIAWTESRKETLN